MDSLDKFNFILLAVLILLTTGMLVQHELMASKNTVSVLDGKEAMIKQYEERIARDAIIYKEVVVAKDENRQQDAMTMLDEIIRSHPENPQSYVLQAEIIHTKGQLAKAIATYRIAIEMEPDLVDNKTPLFIGDSVMDLITVARGKLNREKKLKPDDKTIAVALENIYYLQRRIAGGCE
ncbi:MAG: hypothetical protein U9R57_13140 [Thermodesulfobacteriota bacterium]|nr:hypothetical protein [Thermodesulfobacteriota bacterium]